MRTSSLRRSLCTRLLGSALVVGAALASWPLPSASACGCFSTQTVATPVVQAGEKLVFSIENGIVTMHVQIQYSGKAADFGWILPLPAIPKDSQGRDGIELGVDELFSQLEARTQPTYTLTRTPCASARSGPSFGCGAADLAGSAELLPKQELPSSPLVKQDSIGPFRYAILKADNKTEMLNWLSMNGYVIANGSDAALAPYIRTGAYFLAVKLISGKSAGDLQPLVIRYQADLPMIPITLTQIASTPELGILVWVFGQARAIPRNYFHTVINEAQLDWQNNVRNYGSVVRRAVAEAPGKHAFITEFADSSERMQHVLAEPGRFDGLAALATQRDPVLFVTGLLPMLIPDDRYGRPASFSIVRRGLAMNGQFAAVVGSAIPMPAALVAEGVTPSQYYTNLRDYLGTDRSRRPSVYSDIEAKLAAFDPVALLGEIQTRIVQPTQAAAAMIDKVSYLTRLYTVLAPEDMNLDPVFSFNATLPAYSNQHGATLDSCDENSAEPILVGTTPSGEKPWRLRLLDGRRQSDGSLGPLAAPYSERIELLRDSGAPELQVDNHEAIAAATQATLSGEGCATQPGRRGSSSPLLAFSAATLCALLLRRRRAAR